MTLPLCFLMCRFSGTLRRGGPSRKGFSGDRPCTKWVSDSHASYHPLSCLLAINYYYYFLALDLPLPQLPHLREPLSSDHPRVSCDLLRVLCRLPCGPHTCTLLCWLTAEATGLQQKGQCRSFTTRLVMNLFLCVCMSVSP